VGLPVPRVQSPALSLLGRVDRLIRVGSVDGNSAPGPGQYFVDVSEHPLIRVRIGGGEVRDEVLMGMVQELRAIAYERPKIGLVYDARQAFSISAGQRRLLAGNLIANGIRDARSVACSAVFIGNSPVTAGVITALGWLMGPLHPVQAFEHEYDAEEWVRRKLGLPGRKASSVA